MALANSDRDGPSIGSRQWAQRENPAAALPACLRPNLVRMHVEQPGERRRLRLRRRRRQRTPPGFACLPSSLRWRSLESTCVLPHGGFASLLCMRLFFHDGTRLGLLWNH